MNKLIVDSISIAIQIGSVGFFRAYLMSILAWRKYFAWVDKDTIILEIDQTMIINLSKAGICFQTKNLLKVRPQLLFNGILLCS